MLTSHSKANVCLLDCVKFGFTVKHAHIHKDTMWVLAYFHIAGGWDFTENMMNKCNILVL